jgi:hypothetical protein
MQTLGMVTRECQFNWKLLRKQVEINCIAEIDLADFQLSQKISNMQSQF